MEDYALVLLSRCSNLLDAESETPKQSYTSEEVSHCLNALAISFDTMYLSSKSEEMQRVAEDALKISRRIDFISRIQRWWFAGEHHRGTCKKRAAENFCDVLENLFTNRAHQLGPALGIDNYVVDIFTEGQIRAGGVSICQASRGVKQNVEEYYRRTRMDCVVQSPKGDIAHPLHRMHRLDPNYCRENITEPCILLCDSADGDEEVSTMGPNVMGIVLSHALPHLSHLALRARQSAVPLVAVEDGALTEKIRSFEGKNVLRLRSKPM